jgi:hypothetical protein
MAKAVEVVEETPFDLVSVEDKLPRFAVNICRCTVDLYLGQKHWPSGFVSDTPNVIRAGTELEADMPITSIRADVFPRVGWVTADGRKSYFHGMEPKG